jgi:hypothetical protein
VPDWEIYFVKSYYSAVRGKTVFLITFNRKRKIVHKETSLMRYAMRRLKTKFSSVVLMVDFVIPRAKGTRLFGEESRAGQAQIPRYAAE